MEALVLVLVGVLLAVGGIWSIRLVLVCAGAGAAWLVADAFGAGLGTAALIAGASGLLALLVGVLAARVLFFVVGLVVGAVVGARLFTILDTGDASVLLAVVFVPAVAVVGGVALERWRERLVGWVTAIGGSALVLAGLGRVDSDVRVVSDPAGYGEQAISVAAWVGLAVLARIVQKRLGGSRRGSSS
ncbi:hypothetical protein NYO98_18015 [Nocardioides sp. STR2]|uniref:DUF4203 domain-containing protein n=1 Tax=Nocardioides pini TaxID=2975053 RepID=A0ABT4CGU4_9ACTN|nr:hypothetical protein [Nocardioides pini]MCY4728180.1 hypothetical protein [Nocardioides pini]